MQLRLYSQTLAHRFGHELASLLADEEWREFRFAVAWARRSGTARLELALRSFLERGGVVRGVVGIDAENTSVEGLADLVGLRAIGDARFWVHHNENPGVTFHPKLYLVRSGTHATLIVGSNNLTESGLLANTEAGLKVSLAANHPVVAETLASLEAWADEGSRLAVELDDIVLDQLREKGYVVPEEVLRRRRIRSTASNRKRRPEDCLFGNVRVPRPAAVTAKPVPTTADDGTVLLMRLRRASETARRTQVQMPIRLLREPFFAGVEGARSRHNGDEHLFREANARGGRNTVKFEVPEIVTFDDPVIRFERDEGALHYWTYDAASPQGRLIMAELESGIIAPTNRTVLTVPTRPDNSTWWRFV